MKRIGKLTLHSETLKVLTPEQAQGVNGGTQLPFYLTQICSALMDCGSRSYGPNRCQYCPPLRGPVA
jgi:hypothetical protein